MKIEPPFGPAAGPSERLKIRGKVVGVVGERIQIRSAQHDRTSIHLKHLC